MGGLRCVFAMPADSARPSVCRLDEGGRCKDEDEGGIATRATVGTRERFEKSCTFRLLYGDVELPPEAVHDGGDEEREGEVLVEADTAAMAAL